MTFEKKVQPEVPAVQPVQTAQAVEEPPLSEILPRFSERTNERNADLCVVLFGYGVDAPNQVKHVDDYRFVGGIGRNIPRTVANAWKTGIRWQDGKPAVSRIYPQAILPNESADAEFSRATGVMPMPAAQLAAMIGATDAKALVEAMGRQQALALAEQLMKNVSG